MDTSESGPGWFADGPQKSFKRSKKVGLKLQNIPSQMFLAKFSFHTDDSDEQ